MTCPTGKRPYDTRAQARAVPQAVPRRRPPRLPVPALRPTGTSAASPRHIKHGDPR